MAFGLSLAAHLPRIGRRLRQPSLHGTVVAIRSELRLLAITRLRRLEQLESHLFVKLAYLTQIFLVYI
jgi:hypothetical protein